MPLFNDLAKNAARGFLKLNEINVMRGRNYDPQFSLVKLGRSKAKLLSHSVDRVALKKIRKAVEKVKQR